MSPRVLLAFAVLLGGASAGAATTAWSGGLARAVGAGQGGMAVATAVFLGGLALGASAARRWAGYARPALPIGLLPFAWLAASDWVLLEVARVGDWVSRLSPAPLGLFAAAVASAILLLPAGALFGAAFVLLVAAAPVGSGGGRRAPGVLLGVACAGAGCGAIAARILLPPGTGLAAVLALGAAVFARVASTRAPGASSGADAPRGHDRTVGAGVALGALAGVAFAAWSRLLAPLLGPEPGATVPLLGLALLATATGVLLASRAAGAGVRLPWSLVTAGLGLGASLWIAGRVPERLLVAGSTGEGARLAGLLAVVAGPTAALGWAIAEALRTGDPSGATARLRARETLAGLALGAGLGGAAARIGLVPAFGSAATILLAAAGALVGAAGLHAKRGGRRGAVLALVSVAPLLAAAVPGVAAALLAWGPEPAVVLALSRPRPAGIALSSGADARLYADFFAGRTLALREGVASTVALVEAPGGSVRVLRDGVEEGRFALDERDAAVPEEAATAALPMLFHPNPERVLVLGHGAGWATETALALGAKAVETAEPDEVLLGLLQERRGRLAARMHGRASVRPDDARVALRRSEAGSWSVIVANTAEPWRVSLGTIEALESVRQALAPDGVYAERLDATALRSSDLERLVAAVLAAFRECAWFRVGDDLVVVASNDPLRPDPARWEKAFAGAASPTLRAAGFANPGALWKHAAHWTAAPEPVARTVDPLSDREAARVVALPERARAAQREAVLPAEAAEVPAAWIRDAAEAWLDAGRLDLARTWERAIPDASDDVDAKRVRARIATAGGEVAAAADLLREATKEAPQRGGLAADLVRALGALAAPGDRGGPVAEAEAVAARFPDDGRVQAAMATAWREARAEPEAQAAGRRALGAKTPRAPPGTALELARSLEATGDAPGALAVLRGDPSTLVTREALDLLLRLSNPPVPEDDPLRGALETMDRERAALRRSEAERALAAGAWDDAARAAGEATVLSPRDTRAWEDRALALLLGGREGDRAEAVAALSKAAASARDRADDRRRAERIAGWFGITELEGR